MKLVTSSRALADPTFGIEVDILYIAWWSELLKTSADLDVASIRILRVWAGVSS